jgi:hypothetical protein
MLINYLTTFVYDMLGERISELKGKIMGQRVLDVEGPWIETTSSLTGSFNGT